MAPEPPNAIAEHLKRGIGLIQSGRPRDAAEAFEKATGEDNNSAEAWARLGDAYIQCGMFGEAADALKELVRVAPRNAKARQNLASALGNCGETELALESYRIAATLDPNDPVIASGVLFALYFADHITEAQIIQEHDQWAKRFADPLKSTRRPHANSREPNRRLKIGYVSPDFRIHPVGRFMLPLFVEHDHERFEIYAYFAAGNVDAITDRIKAKCHVWRDIPGMRDEEAAELIRRDGIDILVDLSMHMGNTIGIFARKPAPVQITYLAYVGTTGLEAMDYRITDPRIEPTPAAFIEKPLMVPHYWCYKPSTGPMEIGPAPYERNRFVTFGSMNSFKKVGHTIRRLWAEVLRAVPDSRMVVHALEGNHRAVFTGEMAALGIDPARISFLGFSTTMDEYMRHYQSIDVVLDTFPYTGGTTTCDALWMGVPIITLAGELGISRMGASILGAVELGDLVAGSAEEFIRIAGNLARQPQVISQLRTTLRDRLLKSPLSDAKLFTRSMEAAFQTAWRAWCQG